ncbi:MAG: RNA polymerase sigma-70 factor [Cytophagales bacterium]|nr:RNA polymerase sigma-70 factor [Cytophagales bacterium]
MTFDATYLKTASPKDFESFFRLYYKPLCLTIARITNDKAAAEDLVQESFIKLWSGRDHLEIKISLKSYLYRMAINAAFEHINRSQRFESLSEATPEPKHDAVNETIHSQDAQDLISKAIERLPPACKTVFVMHRYEDMSYKEIAETLQIAEKTVENQMGKALKLLREYLKDSLLIFILINFLK